ncbi:MAG: hypothetical protein AB2693_29265, partial [Candidatus Thiodiazotropha sp.]
MATDIRSGELAGDIKVSAHGISSTDFRGNTVSDGTGIIGAGSVIDLSATGSEAGMNGGIISKEMQTVVLDQPATIPKVGQRDFQAGMATDTRGIGFVGDLKVSGGESSGTTFQSGIVGGSQTELSGNTAPGSSFGFERVVVSHSDGQIGGLQDNREGALGGGSIFQMGSGGRFIQGTDSHTDLRGQKDIGAGMITSSETGMTGAAVKQEINTFVANQPGEIKSVGQGDFQAGIRTEKAGGTFTEPVGFDIQGTSSGMGFSETRAIRPDTMSSGTIGMTRGDIEKNIVGDQSGVMKEVGMISGFQAGMTTDRKPAGVAGDIRISGHDVSGTDFGTRMTGDIQPEMSRGTAPGSIFGFERVEISHTGGQKPGQEGILTAGDISKNIQTTHEGTGLQTGTSSMAFQTQLSSAGQGSAGADIQSQGSAIDFTGTGDISTVIETGGEAGTTGTAVRKDMHALAVDQPGSINTVGQAGMMTDVRDSGFTSNFITSGQGVSGTNFQTNLAGDGIGIIGTASGVESSPTGEIIGDFQSGGFNRMSGAGIRKDIHTVVADQPRVVKQAGQDTLTTDAGFGAVSGGFEGFATDFQTGRKGDALGIRGTEHGVDLSATRVTGDVGITSTGSGQDFSAAGDIRGDTKITGETG